MPLHLDVLDSTPTLAALRDALAERYAGEQFVSVMPLADSATRSPAYSRRR